ncbi:MAG: protein kinase, partial [Gemmatimonadaceae bacterium]
GTDERADIYSFGCTAYELVTGRPPFNDGSTEDLIEAHRTKLPASVRELRENVPQSLTSLIMRCLQKNPAARPQTADELVTALDAIENEARSPRFTHNVYAAISVVVIALVTLGYFLATRPERADPTVGRVAVAVLPLNHAGGDSTQASLAKGFGDEIASGLVGVPWLRVMSRGGASGFRDQPSYDYRRIGRDLGVEFLLTGSMHEVNGRQLVTVQLINVADGSERWAASFNRPSSELEAERDEIAGSAAESLRPLAAKEFGARAVARPPKYRPNPQAYFLQVQAQQWLDRRGQNVEQSANYFRRAIASDPSYAKAYSGLGMALALYPYFQDKTPAAVREEVVRAARNAIRLDPSLSQPHIALGVAYQQALQWDSAGAEFSTAVHLDAHDVEARVQYGRHLLIRGRTNDALLQFQAAREDDPASALVLSWVSYAYYFLRRRDSARVISDEALNSNSRNLSSVVNGAMIRLGEGDRVQARRLALTAPAQFPLAAYVLAATGTRAETIRRLDEAAKRNPAGAMLNTNRGFSMLGLRDSAAAIDALEKATDAGEIWPTFQPIADPMFDDVRANPRFASLLARVGLRDLSSEQATRPTSRRR